ncbi:retrovirus-related Pol polyprotein from transposon 297 [Trichonephila clavipes]|nr:retrovirus-related Pol polyprotein from transposon 297 [Trichonephila clavipes]
MPSPVQFNCDAHDTIANGQYGAVWSMGHTQQVCVRIVLLPSNVWQQFFERSAFLRQQETDLPPAELWCACSFLADRTIYLSSAGVVLLTRSSPCRLLHIPVVLNDFHSRETTLYDRVKQEILDYHVDKMLKEGTIIPIQSPYTSPGGLCRKNNGLPPDSPEAYRFAVDYRKHNAITKYPRYP